MEQSGQKRMQISSELLGYMLVEEIELSTPRDRHSTL